MQNALARRKGYAQPLVWQRLRAQISGVIVAGIVGPAVTLWLLQPDFLRTLSGRYTIVGCVIAVVLSVYLLRNISHYPGTRASYFVLPSVLSGYVCALMPFGLLRFDYSRPMIVLSIGGTLTWLYVTQLLTERRANMRVAVIPLGEVNALRGLAKLDTRWLSAPQLPDDCQMLVADFRADLPDQWEAFLAESALEGIPVLHVKQLTESMTGQVDIEHLSENSFGSLIPFMGYLRLRRVVDLISAVLLLLLLLPFFLLVALLIRLDSSGPALFRQVRIGYRGAPFRVVKFRTMTAAREDGNMRDDAKTKNNDARVTRIGRFLRKSRIDELPQVINIIRGEMSWIGPRPEAEPLSKWYESELPFYRYRHIVPPGITGWAQVNQGHVVELDDVLNKLHYDFFYIKHFSPWLDSMIVFRTVQTMLTGFGAR